MTKETNFVSTKPIPSACLPTYDFLVNDLFCYADLSEFIAVLDEVFIDYATNTNTRNKRSKLELLSKNKRFLVQLYQRLAEKETTLAH